jgi:two-component system, cell cycle sensor histidine kinase and response regulator CckA
MTDNLHSENNRSPESLILAAEQLDEFQQLYDQAPCGYHSLDREGRFLRINQTELTMLGYDRTEVIGKKFSDLLAPESLQTFIDNFPHFKARGWVTNLKFSMVCKNGQQIPVSLSSRVIKDTDGNFLMTRSVVLDISEQSSLEAARQKTANDLQNAHQRIINIWESMTDAYVTLDANWNFIYANSAAISAFVLMNVNVNEIIGFSLWDVFPATMGDIVEERFRQAIANQAPAHFEFFHQPTDNWFEIHAYPTAQELGVYFRNITDRKISEDNLLRTEARLRYLLSSNPALLYACQATGDYGATFVSDNVKGMLGYESAAFLEKSDFWASRIHPEDADQVFEGITQLFVQGTYSHEYRFLHQDGSYRWVLDDLKLIRDATGEPLEIVGCWSDITEKKQLEAQFLRAQRLESLGTLASGIAHDLNNVLTPIIGIVQLLPKKVPNIDQKTGRLLEILDESARRGADLVKQILSFSRGLEGKPTSTQVTHLLSEIQKIVRQTFPKNIDLELDLASDLWLIAADATMLHQVFMNLCVNARDAMPEGGQLSVSTQNLVIDENYARMNLDAQIGPYVMITIADTGMGMKREVMDRIFDPFFTTKDVGQGTGLGLSTVLGIIKSHRGFVNVYSEVGRGSRFTVYLPATKIAETPVTVEISSPTGHGELILIVDDETAVQEITKVTLEEHGYKVITASDGIEAIAIYAEHKSQISLVLMDLMMPSLDAGTTIRTLHRLNGQVRIVAMSGLAANESVTKGMGDHVQGFLAKPFTAPELLNMLSGILQKSML